jgi:hypothetical protein
VGIDQMEHQDGIPDNPDDPPWCTKSHTKSDCWFLRWFSLYVAPFLAEVVQSLHCTRYNGLVSNLVSNHVVKLIQKKKKKKKKKKGIGICVA